ncbi:hypothetical protein BDZ89DRAFT_1090557 [Hymenopellis radicata]|nr:hypothetical protein BDZ89DRAFT_1090557 [Hymenopellis radicata]
MALVVSPPGLQEATKNSTTTWQVDLESLFHHAKDRFPDVVWEVGVDDNNEDVCGHKAIVYARAPPSFQSRYFNFRPHIAPSPLGFSSSPTTTSALSLSGTPLRLHVAINPALFANELEYLYTGQVSFDSSESRIEGDAEELRIDKLRKDLVYMWRSRLYSDVRIELTGTFSSSNPEHSTAIFSSHRFILVSRCSYFHTALIAWPSAKAHPSNEPLTLSLPSPPFTPASLHFTLGFIYTGTLVFSHRSYDLDTAFHIMRSATYLSLQTLYDEIQARIVQEMMHGLFHAFLEFSDKWGTGGCRCRQCARRAPRVLEFALSDDVKNAHLDRGARRALVGLFGEGWCTHEFSALPPKLKDNLLKGVGKRTTPMNVFALLYAAEHALNKLTNVIDAWADSVRDYILNGRKTIDSVFAGSSEACFSQPDWLELMESDGVRFEDGERVEWVMASVKRGLNDKNAALVYQTLVSSILLRPHATDSNQPMLSPTSHVRVQVEQTRMDVLQWLKKRWLGVRQEGGFDDVEGWAVKEISDYIEVPLEDLLKPVPNKPPRPSPSPSTKDTDSVSDMQSMRVSVLSRNLPRVTSPSNASVRSVRTTASRITPLTPPGSTLGRTTPTPSVNEPVEESAEESAEEPATEERTTPRQPLPKKIVGPVASSRRISSVRPKSTASVSSPPVPSPRPSSRASSVAGAPGSVSRTATANSRSRKSSTASNMSTSSVKTNASTRTTGTTSKTTPKKPSSITPSVKSTISTRSTSSPAKKPVGKTGPVPVPPLPKATRKTESVASTNSTATLKRKGSADTITTPANTKYPSSTSKPLDDSLPTPPETRGAMLEIGIPVRAVYREVAGEAGPWVGVEVPGTYTGVDTGEWNDGTWGGIRYFDIHPAAEAWDDFGGGGGRSWIMKGTKRSAGDGLAGGGRKRMRVRSASPSGSESEVGMESRGLFVRPQQVLYVVDAIDGDL